MPWNPEIYNQFKNIRYRPFFDLMELISPDKLKTAVDIGCGTGEQTKILSEKFDKANFIGFDSSHEMLAKSRELETNSLHFTTGTVEDFIVSNKDRRFDLIFSNAALQWSDNHETLFAQLISMLSNNGQFAIQMPVQKENLLNQLLTELVQEQPFAGLLNGWKRDSPVLSIDEYAQIMFQNGLGNIQIMQKVYPIIADEPEKLFNFISGSALIPYMERLAEPAQKQLTTEFKLRIKKAFNNFPALYAFKRLLMYGNRK